jgi:redox-sensitive bicupin YhaK (pirin superfamily)
VPASSPTLYLDLALARGAALALDFLDPAHEHALYAIEPGARLGDAPLAPHTMSVLPKNGESVLRADATARLVLIGGANLGPRHIWWNFVSSRKERIVQAADDWAADRFAAVPGDDERVPLPEKRP